MPLICISALLWANGFKCLTKNMLLNTFNFGYCQTDILAMNEDPDEMTQFGSISSGSALFAKIKTIFRD